MIASRRHALALAALTVLAPPGCSDDVERPDSPRAERSDRPGPATAVWEVVDGLREDLARPRHPSDGGGRAWLEQAEGDPSHAVAGTPGRFTVVYEVGALGVATGGMIFFQVSPFWGWSTPQVEVPDAPGYTLVTASADDIGFEALTLNQQLLGIEVTGRPLVEGDRLRIVFGAGGAGAVADRFAEKNSRFWIGVDGDGDGIRAFLPDSPGIDVLPREPARLVVTLPTVARPGEIVNVTVAVLDIQGSTGVRASGEVAFEETPAGFRIQEHVALEPADLGRKTIQAVAGSPGVVRLHATFAGDLRGESNPLVVSEEGPRVLWGDLHGHTALTDGTGTPEDYFLYARDVAGLDVVALTDHDHWGVLMLDANPAMWDEIREQTRRFHDPGRFVTLLGFEWTSWIHGHRHVLYFDDDGEVISSIDPDTESPLQLWRALEGRRALTFAHHSAGGPIATNWEIPPDPHFEPVTEIVSVHGSSEAPDSPLSIYSPVAGNFVRDVLQRGYRLGFIGSGDSHDGHPGLAQLASPSGGGLAAILSEDRTRDGVLAALRARRVYATNGPRILLRAALGPHRMGAAVPVPANGSLSLELFVRVVSPAPLERVDLIRSGTVVDSVAAEGVLEVSLQRPVEDLVAGETLYVRAVQVDGGAAWSSPFFLE